MTISVKEALPPVRLFIGGEWCEASSGETFPTVNPATEEKIADVASASPDDVGHAVEAARAAVAGGWTPSAVPPGIADVWCTASPPA